MRIFFVTFLCLYVRFASSKPVIEDDFPKPSSLIPDMVKHAKAFVRRYLNASELSALIKTTREMRLAGASQAQTRQAVLAFLTRTLDAAEKTEIASRKTELETLFSGSGSGNLDAPLNGGSDLQASSLQAATTKIGLITGTPSDWAEPKIDTTTSVTRTTTAPNNNAVPVEIKLSDEPSKIVLPELESSGDDDLLLPPEDVVERN